MLCITGCDYVHCQRISHPHASMWQCKRLHNILSATPANRTAHLLLHVLLLLPLQLSLPHVAAKLHGPLLHRQGMQLLHLLRRQPAQRQLLQLLLILLLLLLLLLGALHNAIRH